MALRATQLPPNWQINAISWAANKAGMSYGLYKETVLQNNPKMPALIEEEYKAHYFATKKAEADRIAAAKRAAAARKRRAEEKVAATLGAGA